MGSEILRGKQHVVKNFHHVLKIVYHVFNFNHVFNFCRTWAAIMMRVNKIKNVACKIPKVETDAEDKLLKDCDFDTSGMIILIMLFISKG